LLLTIAAFVFVLGVLIFVHELGHFLMARRIGVRVITFSLGFGPKLFGFTRGGTEYRVSAVPLGGYVKMAGETPDDPRNGQPDEFLSKTKWQRFQVLIMGPVMNILLAVVLMWVVLMQGDREPSFLRRPVKVGAVAAGSPAERGGVRPGDVIATVSGHRVDTWEQFSMAIGPKARREVAIEVDRDGRTVPLTVTPDAQTKYEIGDIGVFPDVHPSIAQVVSGEAAERGGLKTGDIVFAFNGQPITYSWQLTEAIAKRPNQVVVFDVQRGAERLAISVTSTLQGKKGRVGISILDDSILVQRGPWEAAKLSVQRSYESGGAIFQTLVGLMTRETSPKQLTGPLGIAQLSGDAAALGWIALLSFMAMISLNLGILNLLPIPVLDGGHIFIMALEGLARRDFSTKVKEGLLLAGFAVLMLLMVTVIYNDLTRVAWINRLMFWR
jgi:regulator of sigma E protease